MRRFPRRESAASTSSAVTSADSDFDSSTGSEDSASMAEHMSPTSSSQNRQGDCFCLTFFLLVFAFLVYAGSLGVRDFLLYADPIAAAAKICSPLSSAQEMCSTLRGGHEGAVTVETVASVQSSNGILMIVQALAASYIQAVQAVEGLLDPTAEVLKTVKAAHGDAASASNSCMQLGSATRDAAGASPAEPSLPDLGTSPDSTLEMVRSQASVLKGWASHAVVKWREHCDGVSDALRARVGAVEKLLEARVDALAAEALEVSSNTFQRLQRRIDRESSEAFGNLTSTLCPEIEATADDIEDLACVKLKASATEFLDRLGNESQNAMTSLLSGFIPASIEEALTEGVAKQLRNLLGGALMQLCDAGKRLTEEGVSRLNCTGRIPAARDTLSDFVAPLGDALPDMLQRLITSVRDALKALSGTIASKLDDIFVVGSGVCGEIERVAQSGADLTMHLADAVLEAPTVTEALARLDHAQASTAAHFAGASDLLNGNLSALQRSISPPSAECTTDAAGALAASGLLDMPAFQALVDAMDGSAEFLSQRAEDVNALVGMPCDKFDELHVVCADAFESSFDQPFAKYAFIAGILIGVVSVLTLIALRILMVKPVCLVWVSFWFGLIAVMYGIAISLLLGNLLLVLILFVVMIWKVTRHFCCRNSIKSSGRLIGAGIQEAVKTMKLQIWLVGLGVFAFQSFLLILAGGVVYHLQDSYLSRALGDTFMVAFIIFALVWSVEVVSNIFDVTISCVLGHAWGIATPARTTAGAFGFAMSMMGTVARGSFWIALLKAVQYVLVRAKKKAEEKNPCNPVVLLAAVCACFCLEEILEVCNSKAFVYVGLEGATYTRGLRHVRKTFRPIKITKKGGIPRITSEGGSKKLGKALVFDAILDELLDLAQWLVMNISAVLSLFLGYHLAIFSDGTTNWITQFVIRPFLCIVVAALVTYALMLTMERLVEACACTLFVVLRDGRCKFHDESKRRDLVARLPEKLRKKFMTSDRIITASSSSALGSSSASEDDGEVAEGAPGAVDGVLLSDWPQQPVPLQSYVVPAQPQAVMQGGLGGGAVVMPFMTQPLYFTSGPAVNR